MYCIFAYVYILICAEKPKEDFISSGAEVTVGS